MSLNGFNAQNSNVESTIDSGLGCIVMLSRFFEIATTYEQLEHEHKTVDALDSGDIVLILRKLGMKAKTVDIESSRLAATPLPAIAKAITGDFFIIARSTDGKVLVHHPAAIRPDVITIEELESRWTGTLVLVRSDSHHAASNSKFDFTWFIPSLVKYRKLLAEVLLVSFVLQILALVTPLFFQVVMDKVLVHHGISTLDVIAIGLVVVMVFETILSGLRSYVFSHTASRIDVELGTKLFRHLLALPMPYFQARRVGDSVARMRELENIRTFLTGNSVTLVLDVIFSIVFIGVMFYYSGWLTLIVVLSLPFYVIVSLFITPALRKKIDESASKGAENQAFLVETISAIDTLKSMAIEPHVSRRWDNQLAAYVSATFKTQSLSTYANESVSIIGKLVTAATLWYGAKLVISGDLTVGQLIAFNMLAGRVAQPIMRIANLWTAFQQTGVSVQRLGEILNTRTESPIRSQTSLPILKGSIHFDQVSFRYRSDGADTIKNLSLDIAAGEVIGIVGRSGSGKSTLTRLLQRLYVPASGRITVDGLDLAMADVASLRRQIGVVLQENILFNRSVRENIALTDPAAPLEKVVAAAKLSGAHDFILELPEGYDTVVGEHGASLSGGQRQRIAIARALIGNPRILIFDEATSALDYESERVIQNNMKSIAKGRTVIIIAHRLSAVREANRIIVLDRGQIVEVGSHAELLNQQAGHYSRLYRLQQGGV